MNFIELRRRLECAEQRFIHFFAAGKALATISFKELAARAATLRARLQDQGLASGSRVGILSPNSVDWLIWDLALIELGCTVVALPDDLLQDRGAAVFDIYDLALVVRSQDAPAAAVLDGHPHVAAMHDMAVQPLTCRQALGDRPFGVDRVCSLTFSSGVSGTPKCLMINAAGIEWDVLHYIPEYRPRPDDRLLIFLPLTHQQQRLLLYAAYWLSTSLILIRPEQLFDALKRTQPTLCLAPPLLYEGIHERFLAAMDALPPKRRAQFELLRRWASRVPGWLGVRLRRALFRKVHEGLGGRMRLMITGMAPIKRPVLDFFAEAGIALFEAYGLTETGVIAANLPGHARVGSVGKPVKGSRVCVAEDGELLVSRPHFASHGYLDDQGHSLPFTPGKPVATGDIGRFDEDGYLYLLGRKKEIIITSQGHKLHPERIEAMLHDHPAVAKAVVFGDTFKHLVILVSLRVPETPELVAEINTLAADVGRRVGQAAQISKVVFITEQFTLANGLLTRSLKLNRRAIEARYSVQLFGRERQPAMELTAEQLGALDPALVAEVSSIWREILECANVPLTVNFFDLGGDSLSAMRVANHVHERLGVQLQLEDLLREPTVYGMVKRLSAARPSPAPSEPEQALEEGAI